MSDNTDPPTGEEEATEEDVFGASMGKPVDLGARLVVSRERMREIRFGGLEFGAIEGTVFPTDLLLEAGLATVNTGRTDAEILSIAVLRFRKELTEEVQRIGDQFRSGKDRDD